MKTFFKTLWTAMLLFIGVSASAAITSGYYRIKSSYYDGRYITENTGDHTLITSSLSSSNYAQVWYLTVSNNNQVTIKNALTDRYISTVSNYSEVYPTKTTSKQYTYAETNGTYTFAEDNGYGLHCAATQSYNVVRWYTNAEASVWTIEPASVNQTELNSQKNALQEATTAQLTNFFTSTACTELKSTYTNYTDANLRSAMSSLPTSVQNLAIKVKNNSWTTYSGWDKTEKTFRVANYKPYSNGDRWTTILGHKHHLGRLSNPTGIYAEAGDFLQVYVGAIPSGQTVKLEIAGFGQASGALYSLHQGMNVVYAPSAGNCFVFYEVDNTTNGTAPFTSLSDYAEVTVHIEGGTVQGYLDLTKGDDDDDWTQMNNHLLSKETVCLKSTKNVMNLYKEWLLTALNGSSVVDMVNVWKNLSEWEDELIGRSDTQGQTTYGQYCNNVTSVTSLPGYGSPHASHYGTFYYDYSHNAIFNANALMTVADNMWCIAHEQGHNRQGPINMVGNTEISNNLFSNVAIYKQGRYTSRTASIQETFRDFQEGLSWPERVAKSCGNVGNYNQQMLRLNWQLYLYFHVLGKDPDFFPRLFDALRADPMTSVSGENNLTPADTDYLKYYKKCCQVSGYDLTDFFAAYGFFILLPEQETSKTYNNVTTNRYVTIGDYSTYNIYVTQEMINNAKTAVANMNLPKCNIVFIEDRVSAPDATYEGAAAGAKKTINPDAPVTAFGQVGEMGQYTDFDVTPSSYTFNVDASGHVTTQGTGAIGFIVYDANGDIAGFYNTTSFTLPGPLSDGYTIKAAAGDGTIAPATRDKSIAVNITEFPRADMWYALCSTLRGNKYICSNGAGQGVVGQAVTSPSEAMQWRFIRRGGEGETYDIINRSDGSYLSPLAEHDTQIFTSSTQPSVGWEIKAAATDNMYVIYCTSSSDIGTELNQTNNTEIYNWGAWYGGVNTNDTGCQYTFEEIEIIPTLFNEALEELEDWTISVSSIAAANLTPGQWYVMFNRGIRDNIYPHGYLYEKVSSHTLYNTATLPSGSATDACKYLVRLIDAGNGGYYIQTGYGNYFGKIEHNTPVTVIPTTSESIIINKIANTDGHFYLQGKTSDIILDANDLSAGDDKATVVGWNTTVPTSINGNNDWAFYPVKLAFAPTTTTVYTINNTQQYRGALTYDSDNSEKFIWSSGESHAAAFDAANANCQWIFVPTDVANQYYLYNVGKQKFVVPTKSGSYDGYSWMFSSDAVPVQLFLQSDDTYKIKTVSNDIYISVSNNYKGPIINYNDEGAMFTITKQGYVSNAASAQLAAAVAAKPGTSKTMALNAVGGKSYATLYLDYDAQTDENTKAYYITEATSGSAQLTPVDGEGRNIPAYTAVVLINENGTANPTFNTGFSFSSGYAESVAEGTNMLKGTLVSMDLDLGETTPYYSLGNNNGIGFYKFNDGTTSIITLGANKAYLEAGASSSKGFIFTFDDATAIAPIVNGQSSMVNDNWYTLDGRKLLGKPTMPGIYINNGKKIMIR